MSKALLKKLNEKYPNTNPSWNYYYKKMLVYHQEKNLNWFTFQKIKIEYLKNNPKIIPHYIYHLMVNKRNLKIFLILFLLYNIYFFLTHYKIIFEINNI